MKRLSRKAIAVVLLCLASWGIAVPAAQAAAADDVHVVDCAKKDGTVESSEWGTSREASTSALDCVKGGGEATVYLKESS